MYLLNKVNAMDSLPLVSIIIPVYNGEKYIENCIKSAISQTYQNIEIIIVNDGSTDNSALLMTKYKQLDSRIICINKKNEGVVLARKAGFDKAIGKYIQYLDADDTLIHDAIERLVRRAEETNADIVAAPFYFCHLDKKPELSPLLQFDELSGIDYFREILLGRAYWAMWANFQRRALSLDSPIRIVPEITYGEDSILMAQLILNASKVVSLPNPNVNYNKHLESVTARMDNSKYHQLRTSQKWIEDYVKGKNLEPICAKELACRHIQIAFYTIHWGKYYDITKDMKRIAIDLKVYPDLKSSLTKKQRKIVQWFRINPFLGHLKLFYYKQRREI